MKPVFAASMLVGLASCAEVSAGSISVDPAASGDAAAVSLAPWEAEAEGRIEFIDPSGKVLPLRRAEVAVVAFGSVPLGAGKTDEKGAFSLVSFNFVKDVSLRVCAKSDTVQVNLENNWADTHRCINIAHAQIANQKVTFASTPISVGTVGVKDAHVFSMFDTALRAEQFLRDFYPVAPKGKVRIVPCTGCNTLAFAKTATATDIWINWKHAGSDATLLHEYGHHVENLMGNWIAWPAIHDGCYVGPIVDHKDKCTIDDAQNNWHAFWSQNTPVYAMFEGFPALFSALVRRHDPRWPWPTGPSSSYRPIQSTSQPCQCPIHGHWSFFARAVIQADAIEDYVAWILWELATAPKPTDDSIGPFTFKSAVSRIFGIIDSAKGFPTYAQFEASWLKSYPNSPIKTRWAVYNTVP